MNTNSVPFGTPSLLGIITTALNDAWQAVESELKEIRLEHWNESVFRYFFIKSWIRQPRACCQTEWKKIDLLLSVDDLFAFVEFKFHGCKPLDQPSKPYYLKASKPSNKNFEEFCECVKKLVNAQKPPWAQRKPAARYIALVYPKNEHFRNKGFGHWYSEIKLLEDVSSIARLEKVAACPTISLPDGDTLHCELHEVRCLG